MSKTRTKAVATFSGRVYGSTISAREWAVRADGCVFQRCLMRNAGAGNWTAWQYHGKGNIDAIPEKATDSLGAMHRKDFCAYVPAASLPTNRRQPYEQ